MLELERYVDQISSQKTVTAVFNKLTNAMDTLGFDSVSFQTLTGFDDCQTSLLSGPGMSAPDAFINANHPLFKQALKQSGPFFEKERSLCIPLRGVGGSFALIRASRSDTIANEQNRRKRQQVSILSYANAIASIFYTRLCTLCFEHQTPKVLTKKEQHILTLVSQGQTKATIAESLDVTSHAVDFHFRNILKKHDTHRIIVAVASSIRSGAI